MKKILLLILFCNSVFSQELFQNIKGKIVDKESGGEIPGAIVRVKGDTTNKLNSVTDPQGFFKITGVPVGRRTLIVSITGYKVYVASDLIINSGKEVYLNIELEGSVTEIEEVVVKADNDKGSFNEMSSVSTKVFSIEETERYAGSRSDPARMASNFAGVQGTNDARNDIVIRGNSPSGLLWRLEEIDIPNPNHFAVAGSMGGPVSIINNKYLSNSEFYTGAFPASYGNALGGVFDLKMKNGNNEKHERTFQLGLLGTELNLEGPLSKKSGASYLVNYRYSTLDIFKSLNINLGTSAVPSYQDMGLRLNFPTKNMGVFSISAIGGMSKIAIQLSKDTVRPKELYGDQNRDQYFGTRMGVLILNHVISLDSKTMMKTSIAHSYSQAGTRHFLILRDNNYKPNDTLPQVIDYLFKEQKTTVSTYIKRKVNSRNSFKTGIFANRFMIDFYDLVKVNGVNDTIATQIEKKPWKNRLNARGDFYLIQPYFNFTHKFTDNLTTNIGLFGQWLSFNNSYSIEPRAGLKWNINSKSMLSFGYGLHSQMQPTYIYFAAPDSIVRNGVVSANVDKIADNKNLGLSKSHHIVLGYDYFATKNLKIKAEVFYQYLFNIPVYSIPSSTSLINRGATFTRFFPIYTMQNTGTGYNYGLELTVEKLFSNHYFFLFSGSVFDSKYTASNGLLLNTDYNGRFMTNALGGLEYTLGKKKKASINFGPKLTYGGGRLYSPVDRVASDRIMDVVPIDSLANTLQFQDYFRFDFRLAYKYNAKKATFEFALDLVNVTGQQNVLALTYAPDPQDRNADPLVKNYQLGRLPIFYFKIDF